MSKEKKKRGRPSIFTQEIADEICRRLSEGETLIAICRDEGFPAESCVRSWALDRSNPFSAKYAHARELGYQRMADQVMEIADDDAKDFVMNAKGDMVPDYENINRSRLRVDTRKWLLSKALPKIYGDKLELKEPETHKDEDTQSAEPGTLLKMVK